MIIRSSWSVPMIQSAKSLIAHGQKKVSGGFIKAYN